MTNHLLTYHRGQDPQELIKIQILQAAPDADTAKQLELSWTRRLFAFHPTGLNVREEEENWFHTYFKSISEVRNLLPMKFNKSMKLSFVKPSNSNCRSSVNQQPIYAKHRTSSISKFVSADLLWSWLLHLHAVQLELLHHCPGGVWD